VVAERLKKLKQHDRSYLAHEYFNRDWLPMPFSKMAQWLEPAKVGFACSADYLSHVGAVNFTPEQAALLKEIPDPLFQETVRDVSVNQQFRKDYWVKGARKLNGLEQAQAYREQKVMLAVHRESVSLKVNGVRGEVTMQEAVYGPILGVLADHRPKTLSQVEHALKGQEITFAQIAQAVLVLSHSATLVAVQDESIISKARKHTDKLNAWLMNRSRSSGEVTFLASPVSGGGVLVGRFHQLFLLGVSAGQKQPTDWANFAWTVIQAQGGKIMKEGKTLETPEENLAELTAEAEDFATKRLPVLKALQVI
jgi:hypothetical protein